MPASLVERVPLPNLKVYSAGSVLLVSAAAYYALSVTGDPAWRGNATQAEGAVPPARASAEPRNLTDQLTEVVTFMVQEPLCMWTLLNLAYCLLALAARGAAGAALGPLRAAEAQRLRDRLWNFVFYKFIFVFGVLNVQFVDEVLLWAGWFSVLAALHLLAQLAHDRFTYLSSSPGGESGAGGARLSLLLGAVVAGGGALLAAAARLVAPLSADTFAFMAAECVLVMTAALQVLARQALLLRGADPAAPLAYYTQLVFDSVSLGVEALHVVHQVVASRLAVSLASLVLLLQLRQLLQRLTRRLRSHRRYQRRALTIAATCPMASPEEVEKNQDKCAICWEPMTQARKLPCAHLFHSSCLCRWVQQDASCPTCRRALAGAPPPAEPPPQPDTEQLFQFNGSRYVSWLPSFSVEVSRREAGGAGEVAAAARQLAAVFPQFGAAQLAAELARHRRPDRTLDDILDGRLQPAPAGPAHTAPETGPMETGPMEEVPVEEVPGFSSSAAEREWRLRQRKERLLRAARERYLARRPAEDPAPSPT